MKPYKRPDGYRTINISEVNKTYRFNRFVAKAFIQNPENKPTVNLLDGYASNNSVNNLEWATHQEQMEHAYKTGLAHGGTRPVIILDSNGEIIAKHNTKKQAIMDYGGRQIHYSNDVQIIGNIIAMKQSYYDALDNDERFAIVTNRFRRMLAFAYVVDGQLVEDGRKTAKMIECTFGYLPNATKKKGLLTSTFTRYHEFL